MAPGSHRSSGLRPAKGQVVAERYELIGVLGSGVETSVYLARDLDSGGEVALKVFRAIAVRNPAALKAFRRDLAVLRDETHPNVVRVLDFDATGDGFYVAMEVVRGSALSADGRSGWPQDAVLEIFEQLADALAWLHDRGVVYGDIRPSSIVADGLAIKLMDFGPQRDLRQVTLQTPDSGSPYASPERFLGRPLTAASDLYAAGAVVYQLVTGEPPHAAMGTLERAVVDPPSVRARAPQVSEGLARIVERCLHPDPSLRPPDAAWIVSECRALRGEAERETPKPSIPTRTLAERIGEQPADAAEVSALLLEICRALSAIHESGLAHPDLAPQNIRIANDGRVSLESFPAPPANATLRMTEPKYAAPEMLLSHAATDEAAHAATDVYVLGLVAYEALAGRDAFRNQLFGDGGEAESELFWMKWHADTAARLRPLSEIREGISPELSKLIERMTEKDHAVRIPTLAAVESVLEQMRRRMTSTEDMELAPVPNAAPPSRSPRALSIVLTAITVVACAGGWLFSGNAVARVRAVAVRMLHGTAVAPAAPPPPAIIETASGPMVLVPAGRFMLGNSAIANESPARTVYLNGFYIDRYEVTNARYRAFTDATGYPQPPAPSWDADYFAKGDYPVLNVSWRDAQSFCSAAGKRLPTEAEWEKAARGSDPGSRTWANWTVDGLANLARPDVSGPVPVGSFHADVSPFGAYDMAGNVHEWVNDRYTLYSGNPAPLENAGANKVVRGGSFALRPPELSPSWRASLDPAVSPGADSPVGFRCAEDIPAVTHPGMPSPR